MLRSSLPWDGTRGYCCPKHGGKEDIGPKRRAESEELRHEIDRITVVMQRGCEEHDKQKNPYCFECYEYLQK